MFNGEIFSVTNYEKTTKFFNAEKFASFDCVGQNDGMQLFEILIHASA